MRAERSPHRGEHDPTRLRLLEAGRELLLERGSGELVEVKLADACAAAGLTTGAAYALWSSQVDYQGDLARFLASTVEWAGPAVVASDLEEIVAVSGGPEEALRRAATAFYRRFTANEDFYLALRFWSVGQPSDQLVEAIRGGYQTAHDGFRELFAAMLALYQLELRDSFTIDQLTTAVIATTEGIALRHRYDPIPGAGDNDALPSAYAEALVALLHHFTEPELGATDPVPPSQPPMGGPTS